MHLQPTSRTDLARLLTEAHARGQRIASLDLRALNRLLEHKPEDMTAKVEAGLTLAALQAELARRGQWLPLDPPEPERLTVGALLATNASGPRRFGHGTARDHLIGLTVALADGRLIRSGGNVVKNVAGYDLMKLFIGSRASLGVIVEATFKLRPLPETEKFVQANCASLDDAERLACALLNSELTPVVLDLHNQAPSATNSLALVVGFAGTMHEVEWQLARAAELGLAQPSSLGYFRDFAGAVNPARKLAVLPASTVGILRGLNGARFVAHVGNGIIYHNGAAAAPAPLSDGVRRLLQRVKDEFDPKHILPEVPQ